MLNVCGFTFQFPAVATDFYKRLEQVLGASPAPHPIGTGNKRDET